MLQQVATAFAWKCVKEYSLLLRRDLFLQLAEFCRSSSRHSLHHTRPHTTQVFQQQLLPDDTLRQGILELWVVKWLC